MDSVIYNGLDPSTAASCGYFKPKAKYDVIDPMWANGFPGINSDTQLIYFPGSFGTFHEGHVSICKAALAKYPGAVLVISPANSDYTVDKYGAWSTKASNKHRYDAIKKMLPEAVIDIEPMLNYVCDHNFTDLLDNFLEIHGLMLSFMEHKPIILCGKDRADFLELNKYTNLVKVEYFDDTTGLSTSALPNTMRPKKALLLRCNNIDEYHLFLKYFHDQYVSASPVLIDDELNRAREFAEGFNLTHTICKEYAHLLPYIKVSRTFENPLEDASFPEGYDPDIKPGMKILDSDIYTGATRDFIVDECGASMMVVLNLETCNDNIELLDISDFRKPHFCYPHADISSRCSMQAFDYDFHQRYAAFRQELNNV